MQSLTNRNEKPDLGLSTPSVMVEQMSDMTIPPLVITKSSESQSEHSVNTGALRVAIGGMQSVTIQPVKKQTTLNSIESPDTHEVSGTHITVEMTNLYTPHHEDHHEEHSHTEDDFHIPIGVEHMITDRTESMRLGVILEENNENNEADRDESTYL